MRFITFLMHIRTFFTKKKIIWTLVIILAALVVWFFFVRTPNNKSIQTATVVKKDIKKTVLTTGQIVSATDLSLSFQTGGIVRRISVKEGDVVTQGQILATLDQGVLGASLESAKGTLAQAKANYEKIKSGVTPQDLAVSQAAVDTANTSLQNAKQNLLNELSTAYNNANTSILSYTNILFSNPQSNSPQFGIPGTIQTNVQLVTTANNDRININMILPAWQTEILAVNENNLDQVVDNSLKNLTTISNYLANIINILTAYTQVTAGGSQTTLSTYQTGVATAKSTVDGAATSLITYRQAVKSAQAALTQAKASLELKKSPARPEDISIAEAQVQSAQGQYNQALAALNNTVIVAPASGTVTQVNIKLGEQATAMTPVIKLLDVDSLHTEAQVSEADIALVQVGQTIDNTFDALGPDKHFESKVLTVNPASTLVSGVVNYKVTGSLDKIPGIKPGMTSNMTILVAQKPAVLVAPSSSVINQDGKKFVRIVNDPKTKSYNQIEVQVGLEGDGGDVEILSGLKEGQEVVTFIK